TRNGDSFLIDGGWRIPFILSVILIGVGFWVRRSLEESPVYQEHREVEQPTTESGKTQLPIVYAIKKNWLSILLGIGLIPISTGGYYIVTTFATSYATGDIADINMDSHLFLQVLTVASFFELVSTLFIGLLADRWNRKLVMLSSLIGT